MKNKYFLIPFGIVKYHQDGKDAEYVFNKQSADNIIKEFKSRGKDLVVDRGFCTLNDPANADAYGWVKNITCNKKGLYVDIEWMDIAKTIEPERHMHLSYCVDFDSSTKNISSLFCLSIVRNSGLDYPIML